MGINTFIRKNSQGLGFAIPAAIVSSYASAVIEAIIKGQIQVPTDEEIIEAIAEVTPEEALHAAVMSFEGGAEKTENGVYVLNTPQGYTLGVWIEGQDLQCMSSVADLNSSAANDANLLRQLLEINHLLKQTKFSLDSESKLWIVARRFTAGMDAVEAYSLIDGVIFTADKYIDSIQKFLETHHPEDDDSEDEDEDEDEDD